jgi:hypothetical protein
MNILARFFQPLITAQVDDYFRREVRRIDYKELACEVAGAIDPRRIAEALQIERIADAILEIAYQVKSEPPQ